MTKLEQLFEERNIEKGNYDQLGLVVCDMLEARGIDPSETYEEFEKEFKKENRMMIAFPTVEQIEEYCKALNDDETFFTWVVEKYNLI